MTQWTTYYLTTVLLLLTTVVKSQHCSYDNTAIIVLTVREKDSINNIPNLRITIVDSADNPVTKTTFVNGQPRIDTLRFWQNPGRTTFKGYIDNESFPMDSKIRFPFAKDNYVFTCSDNFPAKKYRIKIEEIDGKANGEFFSLTWTIPLYDLDKYLLCETFDDLEYSPQYYGTRLYKPIEIIMQRKK